MPRDYLEEYPIIKETWDLINDLREKVLPEYRRAMLEYYSRKPIGLAKQKVGETLDSVDALAGSFVP